jgi:hypothetical protein
MQYLSTLDMREFHSLEEIRPHFASYVQRYNQTVHSSLNGLTPEERFFSEPALIHRLTETAIDNCFLYETDRRVSPDCVITIGNTPYEIHYRYAKQRIKLRYSPDMEKAFVVEPGGELTPVSLRPLDKQENANVKREQFRLSDGGDQA